MPGSVAGQAGREQDGNREQMGAERLETRRLTLRRPVATDIEAIYAIHSNARTLEHNPGDALASMAKAAERFERWDAQWTAEGVGYFSVERREDGATIGFCGVKTVTFRGQRVLNLFYRFDPACWGQGFAGEAVAAVVQHVDCEFAHLPLIARVRPDNTASHRIVSRLGLTEQPTLAEVGEDGFERVHTRRWPSLAPHDGSP